MTILKYKLGDKPLKLIQDIALLKTDRCIINASRDTLALPILVDGKTRGYFFHGTGGLLIDTIIETSKGAVGKPTEKDLKEPFLMVDGTREVESSLEEADPSELSNMGYESTKAFLEKADDICRRFFKRTSKRADFNERASHVFAFTNEKNGFDILISKNEKLMYTSGAKVYVFKGDKGVLTEHGEVVVSKNGKTVIICKNNVLVERGKSF